MKNNVSSIVKMLQELNYILNKKQKKQALEVVVVIFISSWLELLGVTAILPFIQVILTPEELMQNRFIHKICTIMHIDNFNSMLLLVGVSIVIIYVLKNLFMIFSYAKQYSFCTVIKKDLSVKMLTSYMNRDYQYYISANSSEVIRGCLGDIGGVYHIIADFSMLLTEILVVLVIGIYIMILDFWSAFGVLVLAGISMLGMITFFKPLMKRAGQRNVVTNTLQFKTLNQIVIGIKDIYVSKKNFFFITQFDDASEGVKRTEKTQSIVGSCPDRIVEGICVGGLIGIVCIRLLMNNDMIGFIPKLGVFAMAAFRVLPSIGKITNRITDLVFFRTTLARVYDNIREADAYEEKREENSKEKGYDINDSNIQFENQLCIKNVSWRYPEQDKNVLDNISITIQKGESVAFIGSSGSGKTTLIDIILGLLKPLDGTIEMDCYDVYSIPYQWAKNVGYVPQSVFLFDDTIRNNICFGIAEEEIEEDKIWKALEKAQLSEYVRMLPNGLDTMVGDHGIKFSGGQKQRIAIARALYCNPRILVLDEATAALDNETETAVMEAIDSLQGKVTMIIVAHRLSTIRNCNRIYEIKDGKAYEREKSTVLAKA